MMMMIESDYQTQNIRISNRFICFIDHFPEIGYWATQYLEKTKDNNKAYSNSCCFHAKFHLKWSFKILNKEESVGWLRN